MSNSLRRNSSLLWEDEDTQRARAPRSISEHADLISSRLQPGMQNSGTWSQASPTPPRLVPGAGPVQLAFAGVAIQMGRVGWLALQALGAAGAAVLAGIIASYRNRLGRLPTPQELDTALSEQAQQEPAPIVPPATGNDARRRRKDNYEDACEKQYDSDTSICNQVTQTLGKQAGAVCHKSAATRYSECLAYGGPTKIRTPLTITTYY